MLDILTQTEVLSTYPTIEDHRDWPEGAVYRFDRGGHELLRIVRGIEEDVAEAVARDPGEMALLIDGPLVILCSKVGRALPWSGASFHWHRIRRSERIMPTSAEQTKAGSRLDLMLMEATGGRIRAVRSLTLPLDFTRVLHEAILDQVRYTYDPGAERRAMETLLRRCPTPDSLVGYATIRATSVV